MQTTENKRIIPREVLTAKQERLDVYQRVTNQIIEVIEHGVDTWQMPWHRNATMPQNALTGKSYRGVNVLSLWATAVALQYSSGIWAIYAQWTELGAKARNPPPLSSGSFETGTRKPRKANTRKPKRGNYKRTKKIRQGA